jgi:hypothetical protein
VSSEESILKINLKKYETKECTQHLMESLIWQNKTFKRSQKVSIISDEFGDGPYFIHKREDNNTVDILVLVMLSPKCMSICEIINFSSLPDSYDYYDQVFKSHVFVFPESK